MRAVERMINEAAATRRPVLIVGETGTGKERVAAEIHARSSRANKAWQPVNCAGLTPEMADSDLHGHAKGAFTGAMNDRPGLIRASNGGTVFLDEIGTLSFALQAKLLRTLEDPFIRPVGADSDVKVDVRFVAATSADIDELIAQGKSKRDLFARFAYKIEVPALRARPDDIAELATHFLSTHRAEEGLNQHASGFTSAALDRLRSYPWPGNVRELQQVVERALARSASDRAIELDVAHLDLPTPVPRHHAREVATAADALGHVATAILDDLETGLRPPTKIDDLVKKEPALSLHSLLAEAFMARYKGTGADLGAKAKALFGYTDLEGVRRYLRKRDRDE